MIALKITDLRDFTNKLFIREVFDSFWLNQAEITTYNTFSIDGKLHTDFLDSDQLQILQKSGRTYSLWKETRPFCWSSDPWQTHASFFQDRSSAVQNSDTGSCGSGQPFCCPFCHQWTLSESSVQKQNPAMYNRDSFQHIYSRQTSGTVMGRYGTGLFFPASNHI